MNKIFEYYAMLMSKWIPSKPTDAILPFILTLLHEEKITQIDTKDLIVKFKNKYGFDINYFIVHNVLQDFCYTGICSRKGEYYEVKFEKINDDFLIKTTEIDDIQRDIQKLLESFIDFADDIEINFDIAEKALFHFLGNYDVEVINATDLKEVEESDVYNFFFIEYVKKIYEDNEYLYNILVKICEGNMIKSILLNENINTTQVFNNQKIFLDTPIALKILGYYGEFIQKEYEYLIRCWLNQGAEVYIYDHTFIELESVFAVSSKWVESKEIDNTKTSEVTKYFRKMRYSKEEVDDELFKLSENLKHKNIRKYEKKNEPVEFFYENEDEIKNEIIHVYTQNNPRYYYPDYESKIYIDYDVKSIVYSYLIRENNNVRKYNDATVFL